MPQVDPKVVNDIVDRLKKRGLFDKFRKQCLADIDTKVSIYTCACIIAHGIIMFAWTTLGYTNVPLLLLLSSLYAPVMRANGLKVVSSLVQWWRVILYWYYPMLGTTMNSNLAPACVK